MMRKSSWFIAVALVLTLAQTASADWFANNAHYYMIEGGVKLSNYHNRTGLDDGALGFTLAGRSHWSFAGQFNWGLGGQIELGFLDINPRSFQGKALFAFDISAVFPADATTVFTPFIDLFIGPMNIISNSVTYYYLSFEAAIGLRFISGYFTLSVAFVPAYHLGITTDSTPSATPSDIRQFGIHISAGARIF